ncbi:MAG: GNAT family N-acetyltransferase [Candidatus Aenigmarchaeota archaeon]|nr:GNAT family N-acetyltransferase [Candidatus Aenigmarchaeota archaeon]
MPRKASADDVPAINALISYWATEGEVLPRSAAEIAKHLTDFVVEDEDGRVVGVASLAAYGPDLAEIRSVCVDKDYQSRGVGKRIVTAEIEEAGRRGIGKVFVLTRKPDYFLKFGFATGPVIEQKIYRDCVTCPKYGNGCDEIYMEKSLTKQASAASPR